MTSEQSTQHHSSNMYTHSQLLLSNDVDIHHWHPGQVQQCPLHQAPPPCDHSPVTFKFLILHMYDTSITTSHSQCFITKQCLTVSSFWTVGCGRCKGFSGLLHALQFVSMTSAMTVNPLKGHTAGCHLFITVAVPINWLEACLVHYFCSAVSLSTVGQCTLYNVRIHAPLSGRSVNKVRGQSCTNRLTYPSSWSLFFDPVMLAFGSDSTYKCLTWNRQTQVCKPWH